jgi:NAD(P)-dependent dehydrogenase (short-subunit alcohol dehydrogenase family)
VSGPFDIAGRAALVTGATGSLGRALARGLADAGARLALAGGNTDALEALGAELRSGDAAVELVNRRPQTAADAEAIVDAAVAAHGRLDFLVNAGGENRVDKIDQQDPDDFDAVLDANLRGLWLTCRAAGRVMIEQGSGGRVVNTSSTRGRLGHPAGYTAYCTSKSAVDGLTRTLACEWGSHGITVNAIGPTVFRSPLTAWMYEEEGEGRAVREGMLARIPLGRLGEPEDMVGTVLYLLSPGAAFVTGQIVYVDGGYTAG